MADTNEPRRRFRFRRLTSFSLRTALIAITLLAVWLGLHMNSVRKQRAAIRVVERNGGEVYYDYQQQRASPSPAWLLSTFGRDHFHNVVRVNTPDPNGYLGARTDLEERSETADLLGQMDGFPKLEILWLRSSQANDRGLRYAGHQENLRTLVILGPADFTEQGVAHLANLEKLESLSIFKAQITTTFLQKLSSLPNLESVSIVQCELVDEGMERLRKLTQIRTLYLGPIGEAVTDADLVHLKQLTQLEALILTGSNVTDASLQYVAGLKNLRYLSLSGSNFTDNGVRHVAGLKNLQSLSFSGSSITEDSLRHLDGLKKLERLELRGTKVKDASWLQERLPNCKIRL